MVLFLGIIICLLLAWVVAAAFFFGYSIVCLAIVAGAAAAMLIMGVLSIAKKSNKAIAFAGAALSLVLVVVGSVSIVLYGQGINAVIVGMVVMLLFVAMLPFKVSATEATFYNKSGGELAKVTAIKPKGDEIIAKAVLLGSMPETIYIRPGELCKMLAMMDDKVFLSLVGCLIRGFKQNNVKES
jgi:hypothetical protein